MAKAAEMLQHRGLGKFEAPVYLLVAVMVGVIGFVATVNIRHALNAKDALSAKHLLHKSACRKSPKRLIAAKEEMAAEDTKVEKEGETKGTDGSQRPAISPGSNAVNQEAPEVPVKPGEPVQFEGEPSYKPQSVQPTEEPHTETQSISNFIYFDSVIASS